MLWACSDTADVYVFASQLTDDSSPAEAKFAALIENPKNLVKLDQKHLLAVFHGYNHETQQHDTYIITPERNVNVMSINEMTTN